MVIYQTAYDEITEFIASMAPRKLVEFKASATVQSRVADLLEKNQEASLSTEEKSELEHYLLLDHLISLAKIRAQKLLQQTAFSNSTWSNE